MNSRTLIDGPARRRGGRGALHPARWPWALAVAAFLCLPATLASANIGGSARPNMGPGEGAGSIPLVAEMPAGITLVGTPGQILELVGDVPDTAPLRVYPTDVDGQVAVSFGGNVEFALDRDTLATSPVRVEFHAGLVLGPGLAQVGVGGTTSEPFVLEVGTSFGVPLAQVFAPATLDPPSMWLTSVTAEGHWYAGQAFADGHVVVLRQVASF